MSIPSTGLSDHERAGAPDRAGRGARAPPLVVSPKVAMQMLDCGRAHLYKLINARELDSYNEGKSRKITTASIHALIARRLAESQKKAA